MSGVQLDPVRLAAIAEQLRQQIPFAPATSMRAMIDAAGELQRIADLLRAAEEERSKALQEVIKRVMAGCNCQDCKAKRAASSPAAPGSLN